MRKFNLYGSIELAELNALIYYIEKKLRWKGNALRRIIKNLLLKKLIFIEKLSMNPIETILFLMRPIEKI